MTAVAAVSRQFEIKSLGGFQTRAFFRLSPARSYHHRTNAAIPPLCSSIPGGTMMMSVPERRQFRRVVKDQGGPHGPP